jgi:hypothetical protein
MLPVRGRNRLTPYMIGFKRYIRSGLVVSVIGHLGGLIVALLSVSPNAFHAPPPDAMVVEVVMPDELPRFEGTLSKLYSSGSETPSPADGKGLVTQAPPPKPRAQTEQETQQRPIPPHQTQEATAPSPSAPEATQAELVRTEKTEPEKQNKSSERQLAASPPTESSPEQPNIAEEVRQYGSRRTARRRLCRAAGRHQRAWLRLDRAVPGTCRHVFEAGRGRTRRQVQH